MCSTAEHGLKLLNQGAQTYGNAPTSASNEFRSPRILGESEVEMAVHHTPEAIRQSKHLRKHYETALTSINCNESTSSTLSERIEELKRRRLKLERALEQDLHSLELDGCGHGDESQMPEARNVQKSLHRGKVPQSSLDHHTLHQLVSSLLPESHIVEPCTSARESVDSNCGAHLLQQFDEGSQEVARRNANGDEERSWGWVHKCIESLESAMTGLQRFDSEGQNQRGAGSQVSLQSASVSGSLDCSRGGYGSVADSWSLRSSYELSTVPDGHPSWGVHTKVLHPYDEDGQSSADDELQTVSDLSDVELEYPEPPRSVLGSAALLVGQAPQAQEPSPSACASEIADEMDDAEVDTRPELFHSANEYLRGERLQAVPAHTYLKDLSNLRVAHSARYPLLDTDSSPPARPLDASRLSTTSIVSDIGGAVQVGDEARSNHPVSEGAAVDEKNVTPVQHFDRLEELFSMVLGLKADVAKVVDTLRPEPLAVPANQHATQVMEAIGEYIQGQTEVVEALSADIGPGPPVDAAELGTLRSLSTIMRQTTSQLLTLVPPPIASVWSPWSDTGKAHEPADGSATVEAERPAVPVEDHGSSAEPDNFSSCVRVEAGDTAQAVPETSCGPGELSATELPPPGSPAPLAAGCAAEVMSSPARLQLRDTSAASLDRTSLECLKSVAASSRRCRTLGFSSLQSVELLPTPPASAHNRVANVGVDNLSLFQDATSQTVQVSSVGTNTAEAIPGDKGPEEGTQGEALQVGNEDEEKNGDASEMQGEVQPESTDSGREGSSRYSTFVDSLRHHRVTMTQRLQQSVTQSARAPEEPQAHGSCVAGVDASMDVLLAEREKLLAELHLLSTAVAGAPKMKPDPGERSVSHDQASARRPQTAAPTSGAPRKFRSAQERAALAARLASTERVQPDMPSIASQFESGMQDRSTSLGRDSSALDTMTSREKAGADSDTDLEQVLDRTRQLTTANRDPVVCVSSRQAQTEPPTEREGREHAESDEGGASIEGVSNAAGAEQPLLNDEAPTCRGFVDVQALLNPEPERPDSAAVRSVQSCAVQTDSDVVAPVVVLQELATSPNGKPAHPVPSGGAADGAQQGTSQLTDQMPSSMVMTEAENSVDAVRAPPPGTELADRTPASTAIPVSTLLNDSSSQLGTSDFAWYPSASEKKDAVVPEERPRTPTEGGGDESSAHSSGCDEDEASREEGTQTDGGCSGGEELRALAAQLVPVGRSLQADMHALHTQLGRLSEGREAAGADAAAHSSVLDALQLTRAELGESLGHHSAVSAALERLQATGSSCAAEGAELRTAVSALHSDMQHLCQRVDAEADSSRQGFAQLQAQLSSIEQKQADQVHGQATALEAIPASSVGAEDASSGVGLESVVVELGAVTAELRRLLQRAGPTESQQSDHPASAGTQPEPAPPSQPAASSLCPEDDGERFGLPARGPCMELDLSSSAAESDKHSAGCYHDDPQADAGLGKVEAGDSEMDGKSLLELDLSSFPIGPGCSSMLAQRCRQVNSQVGS